MRLSLVTKLTFASIIAFLVVLLGLVAFQVDRQARVMEESINSKGNDLSGLLALSAIQPILNYDFMTLQTLLDRVVKSETVARISYFNTDSSAVASAESNTGLAENINAGEVELDSTSPVLLSKSTALTTRRFIAEIPGDDASSLGYVDLELAIEPFKKQLANQKMLIVKSMIIVGIVLISLIFILVKLIISRPLTKVVRMMNQVAAGDLVVEEMHAGSDEIGDLLKSSKRAIEGIHSALLQDHVDWDKIAEQTRNEKDRIIREREESKILAEKLESVLGAVKAAATGDLSHKLDISGEDAISQVSQGLALFFESLNKSLSSIGKVADKLSTNSTELNDLSLMFGENAGRASKQSNDVAENALRVDNNVESVAGSAESMSDSFVGISENVSTVTAIAEEAV
jgi:methyl-accepting chemotaxis protein